jgi:hypothetical protein
MTQMQSPGADGAAQGSKGVNGDGMSFFHSHRSGWPLPVANEVK